MYMDLKRFNTVVICFHFSIFEPLETVVDLASISDEVL